MHPPNCVLVLAKGLVFMPFVHMYVCDCVSLCVNLKAMVRANFPPTDLWHIGRNVEEYFCVNIHH